MYRKADFFVLPTLNENFGIVIAEALLCGTPVITCKGAPWNVLVDNHCGWWVERSVEDIADMLEEDFSVIQSICNIAEKYAPEYEVEKICNEVENML